MTPPATLRPMPLRPTLVQDRFASVARLLATAGYNKDDISQRFNGSPAAISAAIDQAIAEGDVEEGRLLAILAASLGRPFASEPPRPRSDTLARMAFQRRRYAAVSPDAAQLVVIAPDGMTILALLALPALAANVIFTTRAAFTAIIFASLRASILADISGTVPAENSARQLLRDRPSWQQVARTGLCLGTLGAFVATVAFFDPVAAIILLPLILAPLFIISAITVLACLIETRRATAPLAMLADADLPRYSVLVPLYREANIVDALLGRLDGLDYPRERLEILLLVEESDPEMRNALAARELPGSFQIVTVPDGLPRTKPRALNAGLLAARGDLVVVYDAEDLPEPDQLRRAAAIFAAAPPDVACVQARLAISNVRDGLLTRRFAIDYAALFDCGKAGMARLGWPVPLGGSSNHFRAAMLRKSGAWDAWNVTEDADLGIRLARLGYHVQDLPSTTWEEAPNRLASWMNQRTRWMKGWMQTMLVHARNPARLAADIGLLRTLIIASMGLSVVFGALLMPLFTAGLIWRLTDTLPFGSGPALVVIADAIILECLLLGLLAEILPALVALKRRRALRLAGWILLAPLSYILTSVAAWRALVELVRRPHHWHKTNHGEAKTDGGLSRLD